MKFKVISFTLMCIILAATASAYANNFLHIANTTNEEKTVGITYRLKNSNNDIEKKVTISPKKCVSFEEENFLGIELKEIFFMAKGSESKLPPEIMLAQGEESMDMLFFAGGTFTTISGNNQESLKMLDLSRPLVIKKLGGVDFLFASPCKSFDKEK